jgi:hypothetical protein
MKNSVNRQRAKVTFETKDGRKVAFKATRTTKRKVKP